jgi:hypothetical protein
MARRRVHEGFMAEGVEEKMREAPVATHLAEVR